MGKFYLNNRKLKGSNVNVEYTQAQLDEYIKCAKDPVYFCKQYVKIVNVDRGLITLELYDFQEKLIRAFQGNRFVIGKLPRQVGKTTVVVGYFLHYILFNDNVKCAILANKGALARDILGRLKLAFESLPPWLQQGVVVWNKGDIALENGSKIVAAATASSSIRGESFNLILLDEFAHIKNNLAEEFFDSVYPTISSGKNSKIFIISTPKGLNKFYKIWSEAEEGKNSYFPVEVHWNEVPGRDEKWKADTIANIGLESFLQEFACEFQGSSLALISSSKLKTMRALDPVYQSDEGLRIYKNPPMAIDPYGRPYKLGDYMIIVDVSEGVGEDYSAFSVIRTDVQPYDQVATFRSNVIGPLLYPDIIHRTALFFNEAQVLVEINAMGGQVLAALKDDLEYDNLLSVSRDSKKQSNYLSLDQTYGIRTNKQIKRIGCSNLKQLIENDQLIINDKVTIEEMCNFVRRGPSYQADVGFNDDTVMTCVLFAWMTSQKLFKEITNVDLRKQLHANQIDQLEQSMLPFGMFANGIEEDSEQEFEIDSEGQIWIAG